MLRQLEKIKELCNLIINDKDKDPEDIKIAVEIWMLAKELYHEYLEDLRKKDPYQE